MNVIIKNLDETITVTMPRTRRIVAGGSYESKTLTTTSGRLVEEMIGFRPSLSMTWDWVPADTITALTNLLRSGTLFRVTYPDVSGTMTKVFKISYPTPTVFKFRDGVPVWYDIRLTLLAQEVE